MIYIQDKDSPGFDICQVTQKTIQELVKIASFIPYAVAFNSDGWIKYHISPTSLVDAPGSKLFLLNQQTRQLSAKKLPPIWCINLERRADRKEMMKMSGLPINFFKAVDGKELKMTDEIRKLFEGNDFSYRSAIVGCCFSHVNLWKQLLASNDDAYLIIEDDVEFCENFNDKFSHAVAQVEKQDWDFLYLGFTIYNDIRKSIENELWNNRFPHVTPFDNFHCGCGFFGYAISRSGAEKMLQYIEQNGIKCAIDSLPRLMPNIKRFSMIPHLVKTPYVGPGSNHLDTDIQTDLNILV